MGSPRQHTKSSGSRKHTAYLMVPVRVHDPERVQQLLCDFLAQPAFRLRYEDGHLSGFVKRGEGSKTRGLTRAADWLGVSYSTLHRLAHGKAKHISWSAQYKIQKRLSDDDLPYAKLWAKLDHALIGPKTRRVLASYTRAIERAIQRDNEGSSVTWNYEFGNDNSELTKLDSLVKRLGLPATRWDLARRRAVAPILSWPPLRKRSRKRRPELLKWGIRFECKLVREEARVLRELLHEAD